MLLKAIIDDIPTSPAFLLDEQQLLANLDSLLKLKTASDCKILYAIKALPLAAVIHYFKPALDGVSVSSLFEAQLARELLDPQHSIHLTTPGLRPDQFQQVADLVSHISFNSLSQLGHLRPLANNYSAGIRINPKLSFIDDKRYDPCRQYSKLGVDSSELTKQWPQDIQGVHIHTMFVGLDFQPLISTVNQLLPMLKQQQPLTWFNLGGGYLYPDISQQSGLIALIRLLQRELVEQVFIEPGKALVGNAGYLLSTVLDSFISDGKTVLILDSSVNHHPEIFEYQRKPSLWTEEAESGQSVILAGSSCLAGDLFGEYYFTRIPAIGERIVFKDVGAYSLIKANRFNGYNLPDVYWLNGLQWFLLKHYDYQDYAGQWRGFGS